MVPFEGPPTLPNTEALITLYIFCLYYALLFFLLMGIFRAIFNVMELFSKKVCRPNGYNSVLSVYNGRLTGAKCWVLHLELQVQVQRGRCRAKVEVPGNIIII